VRFPVLSLLSTLAAGFCIAGPDESQSVDPQGQDLSQAASDPTASIMSFQLQNLYSPSYHNAPGADGNVVQFRAAIPFALGNTNNIARLTVPYITDSPSGANGFSDATLFNLTTFDQPWGRWGAGIVALLPTGKDGLSAEKWGLGPAAGFTVADNKLLWGLFNQNIFTVAGKDSRPDVNVSIVQPIFNYSLANGWSVGTSEMSVTYDWDKSEFISLPLGFKVAKLTKIGSQRVQFIGSYEMNFYDTGVTKEETVQFTVKLLVPK
jgi:hypothetical protein